MTRKPSILDPFPTNYNKMRAHYEKHAKKAAKKKAPAKKKPKAKPREEFRQWGFA